MAGFVANLAAPTNGAALRRALQRGVTEAGPLSSNMGQRTPSYCMGWGSSERFLFPSFGTAPDALGSPSVPSGPEDGFDPAPLFDAAGELKLHFVAEKYAGGGNTDLVEGPNRFGRVLEVRLDQFFWEGKDQCKIQLGFPDVDS